MKQQQIEKLREFFPLKDCETIDAFFNWLAEQNMYCFVDVRREAVQNIKGSRLQFYFFDKFDKHNSIYTYSKTPNRPKHKDTERVITQIRNKKSQEAAQVKKEAKKAKKKSKKKKFAFGGEAIRESESKTNNRYEQARCVIETSRPKRTKKPKSASDYSHYRGFDKEELRKARLESKNHKFVHIIYTAMGGSNKKY